MNTHSEASGHLPIPGPVSVTAPGPAALVVKGAAEIRYEGYFGQGMGVGVVMLRAHVRRVFSGQGAGLYQVDVMDHTVSEKGCDYWFMEPSLGVMDDMGNLLRVRS